MTSGVSREINNRGTITDEDNEEAFGYLVYTNNIILAYRPTTYLSAVLWPEGVGGEEK